MFFKLASISLTFNSKSSTHQKSDMGVTQSTEQPIRAPFSAFTTSPYKLSTIPQILTLYKSRDFDFGIDANVVAALLDGDSPLAEKVVKCFDSESEGDDGPLPDLIINGLSFLAALVLLAGLTEEREGEGGENTNPLGANPIRTKANLIFSIFDFHNSGSITAGERRPQ